MKLKNELKRSTKFLMLTTAVAFATGSSGVAHAATGEEYFMSLGKTALGYGTYAVGTGVTVASQTAVRGEAHVLAVGGLVLRIIGGVALGAGLVDTVVHLIGADKASAAALTDFQKLSPKEREALFKKHPELVEWIQKAEKEQKATRLTNQNHSLETPGVSSNHSKPQVNRVQTSAGSQARAKVLAPAAI